MTHLVLKSISCNYKSFALHNINLSLDRGSINCLVGESGSGKSTLLRLISGLEDPASGEITINDKKVFDKNEKLNIPPERRDIALIFQHPSLFANRTILENVKFAVKPEVNKEQFAYEMLEITGMTRYANHPPQSLSGGQQQLVTLARAFAQDPTIILLDEPFSSLDTILRQQIREKIVSLIKMRNLTSVIVTHDPIEALEISDKIAVISCGTIQMCDTPYNIYYRPINIKVAMLFGHINHITGNIKDGFFESVFGKIPLPNNFSAKTKIYVRPEGIKLASNVKDGIHAVVNKAYIFSKIVEVIVNGNKYRMRYMIDSLPSECDIIFIKLDLDYLIYFN